MLLPPIKRVLLGLSAPLVRLLFILLAVWLASGLVVAQEAAPLVQATATAEQGQLAAPTVDDAALSRLSPRSILNRLYADLAERFLSPDLWSNVLQHALYTLLVILLGWMLVVIATFIVRRVQTRLQLPRPAHRRKVDTISSLVLSTTRYVIYIWFALWILSIWNVPTESLVVGTAVLGAAIGFGSQGLVQDVITGLSILAEEQLAVGDYVEIAGKAGAVEEVGLRVVKLRDHLGVQHVVFNRTITMVSNFTSGGVQAVVDVSLENAAVGPRAQEVATRVCRDLARELPFFVQVPIVQGIQQSSTNDVFLRISLRVLPRDTNINELFVERIKRVFAAEKIVIPENRVRVVVVSDLFKGAVTRHKPSDAVKRVKPQKQD